MHLARERAGGGASAVQAPQKQGFSATSIMCCFRLKIGVNSVPKGGQNPSLMNESKPKPDLLAQPKHEQIVAVLAWVSVDQQWTMSRQSQLLRLQHLMKAQPGMIQCHVNYKTRP